MTASMNWVEVSIETADHGRLQAFWRRGTRGAVLLAHGRVFDAESFRPYGEVLAADGYTVMRINFRGYHDSTSGRSGPGAQHEDVLAGARWLETTTGQRVVGLGASMGGGAVFRAAVQDADQFAAIVGWSPVPISADEARALHLPKLVVWSTEEPMAGALAFYYEQLADPKRQHLFKGDAHAQKIWAGPRRAALTQIVAGFLTEVLPAGVSKPG